MIEENNVLGEERAMAVVTVGRGQKQCPQCGAVVGVRLQQCACGHVFVAKTPGAPKTPRAQTPVYDLDQVTKTLAMIDDVRTLVNDLGGIERTQAVLTQVNGLVTRTGSLEGLGGVIEALKPALLPEVKDEVKDEAKGKDEPKGKKKKPSQAEQPAVKEVESEAAA